MSIASWSDLKTSVANWLHRADLASVSEDFIMLAEWEIYRRLRIRAMESALNVSISGGIAMLPEDYVELKYAYIDGQPVQSLQRQPAEWVISNYPNRSADDK